MVSIGFIGIPHSAVRLVNTQDINGRLYYCSMDFYLDVPIGQCLETFFDEVERRKKEALA